MARIVWTSKTHNVAEHTLSEFLEEYQNEVFLIGKRSSFLENLRAFASGVAGIAYTFEDDKGKFKDKFFSTFNKALACGDCDVERT